MKHEWKHLCVKEPEETTEEESEQWHVLMTWLTAIKLVSTRACCFHQDQADYVISLPLTRREGHTAATKLPQTRETKKMGSIRCMQDKVSKTEASLTPWLLTPKGHKRPVQNSAHHHNPSETQKIQWGFNTQHPCPLGCTQGSWPDPSGTRGLALVFSQCPKRLKTDPFSHASWEILRGYFQSSRTSFSLGICHHKRWTSSTSTLLRKSL